MSTTEFDFTRWRLGTVVEVIRGRKKGHRVTRCIVTCRKCNRAGAQAAGGRIIHRARMTGNPNFGCLEPVDWCQDG